MTEKDDKEDNEVLLPISPLSIVSDNKPQKVVDAEGSPGSSQLFWLLVWMAK